MPVVSFSYKKLDSQSEKLVTEVKNVCIRNGIEFSFIVLQALTKYKEEELDKRTDLR